MMKIEAGALHFRALNERIRSSPEEELVIEGCLGHRYLGAGLSGKRLTIHGTPGNALGAYLSGGAIEVYGNAQDAAGDTMDDGAIIIHGSCGDGAGYGMRGGKILIEGDCGYRGGIHMKSYKEKFPVLVIGGRAGSFLGEYQAGGIILVLGHGCGGQTPVSYFCGTGMHGGLIFLRCAEAPQGLPPQVLVREAGVEELSRILPYLAEYCAHFGGSAEALAADRFFVLSPNPDAGYRQLYTCN